MVLLDGFSGIGGFAKGLQDAGFDFKEHYFSEIDKHAIANYKHNFKDAKYAGSVEHIDRDRLPTADIFTFGWPCQDNSIAGKRKGQSGRYQWTARDEKNMSYKRYKELRNSHAFYMGERKSTTKSGLLHEANRIKKELQPHTFIAENVKGLLSVNGGIDIIEAIRLLTDLDTGSPQYTVEMQLFNTSWFLPQNRERLYFVGHHGKTGIKRVFPFTENDHLPKKGKHKISGKVQTQSSIANCLTASMHKMQATGTFLSVKAVLTPERKEKRQNGRRVKTNGEPAFTLNTQDKHGVMINDEQIRCLTEIECERLQGFPDNWTEFGVYDGQVKQISKTQRYKQLGNAVSTVVVQAIGKKLINNLRYGKKMAK